MTGEDRRRHRAIDEVEGFDPYDDGRELEDELDDEDLEEGDAGETLDEADLCEHGNHPLACEWCADEALEDELGEAGEFDDDGDLA